MVITTTEKLDFNSTEEIKKITIRNEGEEGLEWAIEHSSIIWLLFSQTSGTLKGGDDLIITVSVNATESKTGDIIFVGKGQEGFMAEDIQNVPVTFTYIPGNNPPTGTITLDHSAISIGQEVTATANVTDTEDEDNSLLVCWQKEDEATFSSWTTERTYTFQYTNAGTKNIMLIIKDSNNATDTVITSVIVNENQNPVPSFTIEPASGVYPNETITFTASAQDEDDIDDLLFAWEWKTGEGFTAWSSSYIETHSYDSAGEKNITLKVKDTQNAEASLSRTITILSVGLPEVTTYSNPTNINHNSARLKGIITNFGQGTNSVSQHGFSWGTNANADDDYCQMGSTQSSNDFQYLITGLAAETTYYYKAYAENTSGIAYGDVKTFITTQPPAPSVVTTGNIYDITQTSATAEVIINSIGIGITITEHGHCYVEGSAIPVITDNTTNLGAISETGTYTSNIVGLNSNTTYSIRAYCTTSDGTTFYGETITLSTLD